MPAFASGSTLRKYLERFMRIASTRASPSPHREQLVRFPRPSLAAVVLAAASYAAAPRLLPAQAAPGDTASTRAAEPSAGAPLFTRRDAVVAGALVAGTVAMLPFDRRIEVRLQRRGLHPHGFVTTVDSAFRLTAVPGALVIGATMYAVGRVGHFQRVADLGLHGTEAVLLGSAIGGLTKGILGRARPYAVADTNAFDFRLGRGFTGGTAYSSLPSGHVTAAFAAASAVTAETSRWWPHSTPYIATVMYGGATTVAFSRLYDNKHWASDAVLGAAIGTFSGLKVVQYAHAHPKNRIDRWLLATTVAPDGRGGAALAWSIPLGH